MSTMIHIVYSVPQRSVLGVRLFMMYKAHLAPVVQKHNVNIRVLANDTQLIASLSPSSSVMQLERCLAELSHCEPPRAEC